MEIGKVIGQVVCTVRDSQLPLNSLLLVELIDVRTTDAERPSAVALDPIGAGEGELVIMTRGSSAGKNLPPSAPVDLCIVGIIDAVFAGDKTMYKKESGRR